MTKSTITREQLEEWVAQFDEDGGCDATDRQLEALIRQSLAALDSEPVFNLLVSQAGYKGQKQGNNFGFTTLDAARELKEGKYQLYRHAQPAPVVPEEKPMPKALSMYAVDAVAAIAEVKGWNACRAAMLQSGNSPVIPGWIPVSERMPIDFEAVIAFDGDQVYGEAMYSSDDGFTIDGYEPCDRLKLQNVTHWMPLPPPPKEVK